MGADETDGVLVRRHALFGWEAEAPFVDGLALRPTRLGDGPYVIVWRPTMRWAARAAVRRAWKIRFNKQRLQWRTYGDVRTAKMRRHEGGG